MKRCIKKLMSWLSGHLGEAVSIVVLIIGNIYGFSRLIFQHHSHGERLKAVEKELAEHTDSRDLHRNPDFERRFDSIFSELKEIKGMIAQALQARR